MHTFVEYFDVIANVVELGDVELVEKFGVLYVDDVLTGERDVG